MRTIIRINPAYKSLTPFINELAEKGVPSDATIIYDARNKVYTLQREGYSLNVKAFKVPSFPNNYVYGNIRKSKARRSMENAERLMSMNIGTPHPVAYIEKRTATKMKESYFVSIQVDAKNVRNWLENPERETLLPALAKEILRLHEAGVYHKDFSPGNILYTNDGGEYKFYLIDLNRMQFGSLNHAKKMSYFRCIYIESEEETAHLARLYAAAAGLDADAIEREARAELHKHFEHKRTINKLKKIFK